LLVGIFTPLCERQRRIEGIANISDNASGVDSIWSRKSQSAAIRSIALYPTSALHKKRHGQNNLRGSRRYSYGRVVVSRGTKASFKRGTDISKIVSQCTCWSFSGLQIEEIVTVAFQQLYRKAGVPRRYGVVLAA
jgi:hypothetical protein